MVDFHVLVPCWLCSRLKKMLEARLCIHTRPMVDRIRGYGVFSSLAQWHPMRFALVGSMNLVYYLSYSINCVSVALRMSSLTKYTHS